MQCLKNTHSKCIPELAQDIFFYISMFVVSVLIGVNKLIFFVVY